MTTVSTAEAAPMRAADRAISFYRAVWRWHFYAGLMTLPFLILLAVTGGLYLFHHDLDRLIHRDLKQVERRAEAPRKPSEIVASAVASVPGRAVKYVPPESSSASAEVTIRDAAGARQVVYVDPYDARVLGTFSDRGTAMWVVRQLHSLAYFGPVANGAIEIVGGWSILLVATGIYLWWPRRGGGGVVTVRGQPRQRVFWRDLHAVTGIFAGVFILFLAISGMPWSVFWGAKVNEWANGNNFGYPAGVRVAVPMSEDPLHLHGPTAWSLEQAKMPESNANPGQAIGLDAAIARFDALRLTPGYAVNLPAGPKGVYTGSVYPNDLARQRVVHLDQYSGEPLIDMGYADYGTFGKALEWGINVHMGQEFGLANQLLMLAACVAIILLSVSAGVMWWKRRPAGRLGVPPLPARPGTLYGVFAILAIGGAIFPLVGASLIAMLLLDRLISRRTTT
ncbi:PepSY-associated TM helix domain-containing protein [Bosea psychrotolerans]|uniref:Putative iron-regulated membrane protein n=1 Tax=Bosea psychrotolerans TaxID=1871628 RepID=A0A2S4M9Z5_9HYPH|nr:PepSY domain-containing protein [Bosea psychrotolerans]POR51307.1 putative iron-regulated membrane protein [Bosea psychrotolerans]